MDRETMRVKVETYKDLVRQGFERPGIVTKVLDIDRSVMFMVGLYTINSMGLPEFLASDREMNVLRGLCATHLDLGIEKIKTLLTEEEVHA